MKNLKNLKNYHFGMGILIIILQILFQISNIVYLMGIGLIIFSIYENRIITQLTTEKDKIDNKHEILTQYKWVKIFLIFPITALSIKLISEVAYKKEMLEIIYEDPIMWLNFIGIVFIIIHFSTNMEINRIEKEISKL